MLEEKAISIGRLKLPNIEEPRLERWGEKQYGEPAEKKQ